MQHYLFWLLILCASFSGCHQSTLKNKTIVVSAPEIYAIRLKIALEKHKANVVLMPAIETSIHDSIPRLSTSIKQKEYYDYIVLPSRNAIKAFDQIIRKEKAFETWKNHHYYCIGKDTELLLKLGYKNPIKSTEPSLEGILNEIIQQGDYKDKKMLLVAPKVEQMREPSIVPDFEQQANKLGINCHRINGYTTRAITNKENIATLTNLKNGHYDLLALTSGGECLAIANQTDPSKLNCKIACFGPYTAKSARQVGFKVDIISKQFRSFEDYATSIATQLKENY